MVNSVTNGNGRKPAGRPAPPAIVELVGLAGAGKTTLSRVLAQHSEKVVIGADITLRQVEQIPTFAATFPSLLPFLYRPYKWSRPFTWDEIKFLVYLEAWPRLLGQKAQNHAGLILLDHGPIFKLATLKAFGPDDIPDQAWEQWRREIYCRWARTLDLVIWLDAPLPVLLQRINSRNKKHAIKGKPEAESYQFLERYRASYQEVLAELKTHVDLPLLQFDTHQAPADQIAAEVLCTVFQGRPI